MLSVKERIAAAYESDRQNLPRKVLHRSQLPGMYESITPEWLTAIICGKHRGVAVTDYRLADTDQGVADRRKIYLEYSDALYVRDLPGALFCKATHQLSSRVALGITDCARGEVVFYNQIRPLLNIEVPTALFARFEPKTFNSIVVLPEMSEVVSEFCSNSTNITRQRAEEQLALLAQIHGGCYASPQLRAQLYSLQSWQAFFGSVITLGFEQASGKGFLAAKDVIPARLYRQFEAIWPAALASVECHSYLPQTLVHGDVHLKNWYITRAGEMGLTDWQCASRGHWSRDIAHILPSVLSIEQRRAWETELLQFYIDRMQAAGGATVGFREAWTYYRQQLVSALIWWTVTLAGELHLSLDRQPASMEFVRRVAVAMDDLDALQSL